MKFMKYIFILFIISSSLCQIAAREKYEGCIYLSSEKNGDSIDCTLHNETNDTIYLFYSYLKGAFSHTPEYCPKEIIPWGENYHKSRYLRRYNPYYKSFTITYRPYIPLLCHPSESLGLFSHSDSYRVKYHCVPFLLIEIRPLSTLTFRLPSKLIDSCEFVEDFLSIDNPTQTIILDKIRNNQLNKYCNEKGRVNVEVAIYRHADIKQYLEPFYHYPGFYTLRASEIKVYIAPEADHNAINKFIPVNVTILLSDSE